MNKVIVGEMLLKKAIARVTIPEDQNLVEVEEDILVESDNDSIDDVDISDLLYSSEEDVD